MYNRRTLCLSSSYIPIAPIPWERALVLTLMEKADLLEVYDDKVRSPSVEFNVPAVVRLRAYVPRSRRMAKFTKKALCVRDKYECAYCGDKLTPNRITLDHVVPKSRGGTSSFDNLVTSCYACNYTKGQRTPEEANMPLLRKPFAPTFFLGIDEGWRYNGMPEQWTTWIGVK